MAKDSGVIYGASGKTNVLTFEPEKLHLVIDKTHPLYDECIRLPISETMVLNIMDQGVSKPIIVWKDPETGLFCVVDGRQRLCHTLEADKRLTKEGRESLLVPVVAKRGSAIRMAQTTASANEIRQADIPLGRAKKMADALERGYDEDDLVLMFGASVQTVRAMLSLLDTTQVARDAVESGTATATQARRPGVFPPREQRAEVTEIELATADTRGHEKARRQRQISDEAKPCIRPRKETVKALEDASGEYAEALRWVLGEAQWTLNLKITAGAPYSGSQL